MKADEPRQNRIPFMMSDAELTAIDEWRYANKVATRAEAIRRLCEIARSLDSVIPNATDHASDMLTANRLNYYFVSTVASKLERGEPITPVDLKNMIGRAADLVDRAEDVLLVLMRENNRIVSLMDHKNIKTALAVAETAEEQISKIIDAHIANEVPSESKFLREVIDEMTDEERASYDPPKEDRSRKLDAYLLGRIAQKRGAFEAYRPEQYRRPQEEDE